MTETVPQRGFAAMKEFPRAFWLINLIELFERGAYYGTTAVLWFHMVTNLGYTNLQAGLLFSILLPLLYVVPIVSSAFSEKYGFRIALAVSFVILGAGYAMLGTLGSFAGLVAGAVAVGVGGGIFKPIAAAMIGQTTREEDRNLGFFVYYWAINVGAFLTPLVIGYYVPEAFYQYALYVAAALIGLNFVLVVTVFRNVRPPQADKDVWEALRMLGSVAADRRFLVLLLLYSGFWFMYGINLGFLPTYMALYVEVPPWFAVAFLGAVNPGTIILFGPVLARITSNFPSVPLIGGGIAVYVVGVLVLGSTPVFGVFLMGIVVYSLGEFVVQPSFLSYASKISPPDRVAVYMAYSFLPISLGFFVSPLATGYMAETILPAGKVYLFWGIIASVGLATVAGFLLFHAYVTARPTRDALAAEPVPARRRVGGPVAGAVVALLVIPALLGVGAVTSTVVPATDDDLDALGLRSLAARTGTASEGQSVTERVTVPAEARRNVTFELTWTDEAPPAPGLANAPDAFRLRIVGPTARELSGEGSNAPGGPGSVSLLFAEDGLVAAGDYEVEITLVSAGDSSGALPLGVGPMADGGNAWTLNVRYEA